MNKFLVLFIFIFFIDIAFAGDEPWLCHEARIRFLTTQRTAKEIEEILEKCKNQTASLKKKSKEETPSSSDQFGVRHSEK